MSSRPEALLDLDANDFQGLGQAVAEVVRPGEFPPRSGCWGVRLGRSPDRGDLQSQIP